MTFQTVSDYNIAQANLMRDSEHRWFTGEKVGHDPTEDELFQHWVKSGAAIRFAIENKLKR